MSILEQEQVLFDPGAYQVPTEAKTTFSGGAPLNLTDPDQVRMLNKLAPGSYHVARVLVQVDAIGQKYRGPSDALDPLHITGLRVHELIEIEDA